MWSANVARINARTASNAASGASHRLGLTSHTDLTAEEFRAQYLGAPMSPVDRTAPQHQHHTAQHINILHAATSWLSALWRGRQPAVLTKKDKPQQHWRYENVTAPASVDWRTHTPPVLGAIKDQHVNGTPCGSCWAFSAVSIMEISSAMATGEVAGVATCASFRNILCSCFCPQELSHFPVTLCCLVKHTTHHSDACRAVVQYSVKTDHLS